MSLHRCLSRKFRSDLAVARSRPASPPRAVTTCTLTCNSCRLRPTEIATQKNELFDSLNNSRTRNLPPSQMQTRSRFSKSKSAKQLRIGSITGPRLKLATADFGSTSQLNIQRAPDSCWASNATARLITAIGPREFVTYGDNGFWKDAAGKFTESGPRTGGSIGMRKSAGSTRVCDRVRCDWKPTAHSDNATAYLRSVNPYAQLSAPDETRWPHFPGCN